MIRGKILKTRKTIQEIVILIGRAIIITIHHTSMVKNPYKDCCVPGPMISTSHTITVGESLHLSSEYLLYSAAIFSRFPAFSGILSQKTWFGDLTGPGRLSELMSRELGYRPCTCYKSTLWDSFSKAEFPSSIHYSHPPWLKESSSNTQISLMKTEFIFTF